MIKLRYFQEEVVPAFKEFIDKNKDGHPIIALPTGSGKTYAMADMVKYLVGKGNRVLILSHVKEILEQNEASLIKYLGKEVSVYSSMMGRKEIGDITVAGIQSVFRKPERFSKFRYILIDEAHMVNAEPGTMYAKFFSGISKHTRIGFTATPFRLGSGEIFGQGSDTLFTHKILDYCTKDKFQQLVEQGYLSKLTTKRTELEMDTSGINLLGGDFNEKQLSERFDRDGVTTEAIKEIIAAGVNRKKWLIFAIDINHAEHIAETLIRNGIPTAPVHSKMSDSGFDRDRSLDGFGNGIYRCVVNVNILTTGFDEPGIDLIALLRPTSSPVLHVQTLGRGSRIEENKDNCLVLDFAGNTARLGPINDVLLVKRKKGEGGDPITKECPGCKSILPPAVRICPDCGHEFKFEHNLSKNAANIEVMDDGKPHWLSVSGVSYEAVRKIGTPSSVKVTYNCSGRKVNEWICVEHSGFAKHKADHWIKYRGGLPCSTVDDLIEQVNILKVPNELLVQKKNKYYTINNAKFL
jgi:DNA repair protein RadD